MCRKSKQETLSTGLILVRMTNIVTILEMDLFSQKSSFCADFLFSRSVPALM